MRRRGTRRSQGCRTCTTRRIRCDMRRPICQNCENAVFGCGGFPEANVFIDSRPRNLVEELSRTSSRASTPVPSSVESNQFTHSVFSWVDTPLPNAPSIDREVSQPTIQTLPFAGRSNPPLNLGQEGNRRSNSAPSLHATQTAGDEQHWTMRASPSPVLDEQHFSAFLIERFAIGTLGDRRGFSFLRNGLEAVDRGSMISRSTLGLAKLYFGRIFKSRSVFAAGHSAYSDVLRLLIQEIETAGDIRQLGFGFIASILTSIVIEAVILLNPLGWSAHIRGLARIVETQGPLAYQQHPTLMLFEGCRTAIIMEAFKFGERTFLSQQRWRTAPWAIHARWSFMDLWDIMCDITDLFADLQDSAKSVSAPRILGLVTQLLNWRRRWQSRNVDCVFEVSTTALPDQVLFISESVGSMKATTSLAFAEFNHSREIALYHAMLALLFSFGAENFPDPFASYMAREHPIPSPGGVETQSYTSVDLSLLRSSSLSQVINEDETPTLEKSVISFLLILEYQCAVIKSIPAYALHVKFAISVMHRAIPSGWPEARLLGVVAQTLHETSGIGLCGEGVDVFKGVGRGKSPSYVPVIE